MEKVTLQVPDQESSKVITIPDSTTTGDMDRAQELGRLQAMVENLEKVVEGLQRDLNLLQASLEGSNLFLEGQWKELVETVDSMKGQASTPEPIPVLAPDVTPTTLVPPETLPEKSKKKIAGII